jgi:hypothetical protein
LTLQKYIFFPLPRQKPRNFSQLCRKFEGLETTRLRDYESALRQAQGPFVPKSRSPEVNKTIKQ